MQRWFLLIVLAVLLHMVETKGKNLQDNFIQDFDPVLVLIVICHKSKVIKN